MQSSRKEFLDDFLGYINQSGDAEARNIAERLLNRVIETIWLKRSWRQFIMPTAHEFSTAANTREYALPDYFGRVADAEGMIRDLTNKRRIAPIDRATLEHVDPQQGTSQETTGQPRHYVIEGTVGVHTQPAAAGDALEVVSSSSNDTTVRAYIEGIDSNTQYARSQVTLNGTTPMAVGTWKRVTKFGKSYPEGTDPTTELTSSAGTVTLRKVTGATELQRLLSEESARDLQTIVLHPMPGGVYTIAVRIMRAPERILRDADPLPPFWSNAIFEKMVISWRAGDQDGLNIDTAESWPALVDLVCFDTAQAAQVLRHRVPFTG